MRDSVIGTRKVKSGKCKKNYISMGRLISDILIENGLIEHLTNQNKMEGIEADIGKPFNGNNFKILNIVERSWEIIKPSIPEDLQNIKTLRISVFGYPSFTDFDSPTTLTTYIKGIKAECTDNSKIKNNGKKSYTLKRKSDSIQKKKKKTNSKKQKNLEKGDSADINVSASQASKSFEVSYVTSPIPMSPLQTSTTITASSIPPSSMDISTSTEKSKLITPAPQQTRINPEITITTSFTNFSFTIFPPKIRLYKNSTDNHHISTNL
ncbi:unnamed protein product [Vicia faba]|uniref:Uncharacterized protein n=1 Tax=Vicia faba TaxID=3906 RepID=A0AAV0YXT9_VICFA|nr:unnamed protein product [Vicia faba]